MEGVILSPEYFIKTGSNWQRWPPLSTLSILHPLKVHYLEKHAIKTGHKVSAEARISDVVAMVSFDDYRDCFQNTYSKRQVHIGPTEALQGNIMLHITIFTQLS